MPAKLASYDNYRTRLIWNEARSTTSLRIFT
uniref:Uncharacterized protein n=1 Tax=Lepeophtheirus salmonis TaxID=72036 RepID=A0A0K2U4J6_LEPSM